MKNKTETPASAPVAPKTKWKRLGVCAMDTAGLLIADPCYVIHQEGLDPKTLEINDYNAWLESKAEVVVLKFKRGHEGAGVIVHSPYGDGAVEVFGEVDAAGNVRSVFFSFDDELPFNKHEHAALVAAAEVLEAPAMVGLLGNHPLASKRVKVLNALTALRGGKEAA